MKNKFNNKNIAIILWAILLIIGVIIGCILTYNEKNENSIVLDKPDNTEKVCEEEIEEAEEEPKEETKEEPKQDEIKTAVSINNEEQQQKNEAKVKEQEKQQQTTKPNNKVEEKAVNNKAGAVTTYKNGKMGIQLTFPGNWQNKYVVNETSAGIVVAYIFQHNYYVDYYGNRVPRGEGETRYLFCIKEKSKLDENLIATIDGIRDVPKSKIIHGKEYVIGGPTDCLELNDPDRAEVEQFLRDLSGIINNLKEI